MNVKLLMILSSFYAILTYAQPGLAPEVMDSLRKIWQDPASSDSLRLKALDTYAWKGFSNSNQDSALHYATLEYEMALASNNKLYMSDARSLQGMSYMRLGKFRESEQCLIECLAIRLELDLPEKIAGSHNGLGLLMEKKGDYAKAIYHHTESLNIKIQLNDSAGISGSYGNLATIYQKTGDLAKAEELNVKALAINRQIQNVTGTATSLYNLGWICAQAGNYAEANSYYEMSLEIFHKTNNQRGIIVCNNAIGNIQKDQGNPSRALELYQSVLDVCVAMNDRIGIAISYNNLGLAYFRLKDYNQAEIFLQKSLVMRTESNDPRGIAASCNNLGNLFGDQHMYDRALEFFTRAVTIHRDLGDKGALALALSNTGRVYYENGDYHTSMKYASEALEYGTQSGDYISRKNATRQLFLDYLGLNMPDSALLGLNALIGFVEKEIKLNYFNYSEHEKEQYFVTMENDFGSYHDYALRYHTEHPELADSSYNLAVRLKGLSLNSSTAMRSSIIKSGDTTLIAEYNFWLEQRKLLPKINNKIEYALLDSSINALEKSLVKKSQLFSDYEKMRTMKWQDVQQSLVPGQAAIEFISFSGHLTSPDSTIYCALLITSNCVRPKMIRICIEEELRVLLSKKGFNNFQAIEAIYGKKGDSNHDIYNLIWKPLEPHLSGITEVFFSSTGLLHNVSFSSMRSAQQVFLCDTYKLFQTGSTGRINRNSELFWDNKNESLLVIGGVNYGSDSTQHVIWENLPGTLEELNGIQRLTQAKVGAVSTLVFDNATEENLKLLAPDFSTLHLSSHGFFFANPEQQEIHKESNVASTPETDIAFRGGTSYANWNFVFNKNPMMRSGLVLAGANKVWDRDPLSEGEDGILTALEVSNLDLVNTKLVVLSACETGLGDIKGSEGVYGLQRAFKMAGVKYIIMSLWQVPDKETAEFMTTFYRNLTKSEDILEAFNTTQGAMRAKYDPYYWGAFILLE